MTYRNTKILKAAKGAPCQSCGIIDGTIVAAHSNQLRDGRGYAHKSSDYRIAYLCHRCHDFVDGRNGKLDKEGKIEMWEDAHRKTIGYLFEHGIVK